MNAYQTCRPRNDDVWPYNLQRGVYRWESQGLSIQVFLVTNHCGSQTVAAAK